jgi:hypothetical protein
MLVVAGAPVFPASRGPPAGVTISSHDFSFRKLFQV